MVADFIYIGLKTKLGYEIRCFSVVQMLCCKSKRQQRILIIQYHFALSLCPSNEKFERLIRW